MSSQELFEQLLRGLGFLLKSSRYYPVTLPGASGIIPGAVLDSVLIMATRLRNGNQKGFAREDQALPRLCCTPVGTENPLGLLSASRNKPFEKSLDRAILLDLGLEVLSEAGDHLAGHRAGDLLRRRFACFVVLFDEESFIESLDYCVGFFVHKSV